MSDVKRKIIIDCDPGVDDTIELLMALGSGRLEVLGITTAGGNVSAAQTQANARGIVALAKVDVPVYAGLDQPLSGPIDRHTAADAASVHGKSGIDGLVLPPLVGHGESSHGVDFIIDTIRAAPPKTISISATGALTNIAEAFLRAPDIIDRIDQIVLMGGAFGNPSGNVRPHAEFNIAVDPIAADIVFSRAPNIVAVPLDITHQTLYDQDIRTYIRNIDRVIGPNIANMLDNCADHYPDFIGAPPLHDPHTITFMLNPDIYEMQRGFVRVAARGPLTGQTVFTPHENGNTQIPISVDAPEFFREVIWGLEKCIYTAAAKPALDLPRGPAQSAGNLNEPQG